MEVVSMEIKKVLAVISVPFVWLWGVILDFSTFLREGDKTSAFSSKRICGVGLIIVGIKMLFVGLTVFQAIIDKGWYAIFAFIPAVSCFAIATIFFYLNGSIDIANATTAAKEIIEASKCKTER